MNNIIAEFRFLRKADIRYHRIILCMPTAYSSFGMAAIAGSQGSCWQQQHSGCL